jgi:chromate reductase
MFGAVWAQAELRKVLGAIGARLVGDELPVSQAHERCDRVEQQQSGDPTDEELRTRLADILDALVAEAQPHLATAA